jgi:hypothetical protein
MNESATVERETESIGAVGGNSITGRFRMFLPSISDCIFIALMLMLFVGGFGWMTLLADGDTGVHIRTGDWILSTHTAPTHDPFSNTLPDKPWYAWEWLADVVFAALFRVAGLKGVVLFSGIVICLAITILFRHMVWRGAGVHIAVLLSLLVANALRFHFLARPHIFTTLLTAASLRLLDSDWTKPTRKLWLLVPIAVVWANLHGGFLVLIFAAVLFLAAALLRSDWHRARRYGTLAAACSAATLINPYGWNLHLHIWEYLRSDWLVKTIDEFRSPQFREGSMLSFEILLFLGLILVINLVRMRQYPDVLLILCWAHAALLSVRHVTIYAIAAAPAIAEQLEIGWNRWTARQARSSVRGVVRDLVRELTPHATRTSIWSPLFLCLLALSNFGSRWPSDFPSVTLPTALVSRNASLLAGTGTNHQGSRILNPDFWGGYLTFRLYPCRCVFIDGRSDYFGPKILGDYASLRSAADNWQELADRYRFRFALVPREWPLAGALRQSGGWQLRDEDSQALLFERVGDDISRVKTAVYTPPANVSPR